MLNKLFRWIFTLLGMLLGGGIFFLISQYVKPVSDLSALWRFVICVICVAAAGLIFFIIAPRLQKGSERFTQELDQKIRKTPLHEFICGTIGLIVGLLIAMMISSLWKEWEVKIIGTILSAIVYILLGYTGVYLGRWLSKDLVIGIKRINASGNRAPLRAKATERADSKASPKILDTSVIIDGRIADIIKTGFIEGQIIIPEFVLVELRHIADSSDSLKRNRGRRGLDILNKIQTRHGVEIYDTNSEKSLQDIPEVDAKLLQLALIKKGKVVTNDYNLNKVASIKGVSVLNINELANTLKPVVLPGEEMVLSPVREGKENSQALAYLDDGTMIVIEGGKKYIGKNMTAVVTSVLQTSAGRMIFAKPKGAN